MPRGNELIFAVAAIPAPISQQKAFIKIVS